jgi:hypothetical protein
VVAQPAAGGIPSLVDIESAKRASMCSPRLRTRPADAVRDGKCYGLNLLFNPSACGFSWPFVSLDGLAHVVGGWRGLAVYLIRAGVRGWACRQASGSLRRPSRPGPKSGAEYLERLNRMAAGSQAEPGSG